MNPKYAGADQPYKRDALENEQKQAKERLSEADGYDAIPLPVESEIRPVPEVSTKSEEGCFGLLNHLLNDLTEGVDKATAHILANTISSRFKRIESDIAKLQENWLEGENCIWKRVVKTEARLTALEHMQSEAARIAAGIRDPKNNNQTVWIGDGETACDALDRLAGNSPDANDAPEVKVGQWWRWNEGETPFCGNPSHRNYEILGYGCPCDGLEYLRVKYTDALVSQWPESQVKRDATLILDPDDPIVVGDRFEAEEGNVFQTDVREVSDSTKWVCYEDGNTLDVFTITLHELRAMRRLPNVKWLEPTTEESSAVQSGPIDTDDQRERDLLRRQVREIGAYDEEGNWAGRTGERTYEDAYNALTPPDAPYIWQDDIEHKTLDEMTDYLWSIGVRSSWREEVGG